MMGKDFAAGHIALLNFLSYPEARIITTSVKDDHLRVLWGEIGRAIQSSKYPLDSRQGGPLIINHRDIRKIVKGKECKISYLRGMVSERGEGLAGHHAAFTQAIIDEASGTDDMVYTQLGTWAKHILSIGNCNPTTNWWYKAIKAGNLRSADGSKYHRRIIRIRAEDSPNVRLGLAQVAAGTFTTEEVILPGVLTYGEYLRRLATWDPIRIHIGLKGLFWEGAEVLLYPPDWLDRAEREDLYRLCQSTPVEAIGIDPAEGGDQTAMAAVNRYGLKELVSRKTPDTDVITGEALAFIRKHNVDPRKVAFDRGGGGKQHADRLRAMGYAVKTIAFGESIALDPKRGLHLLSSRLDTKEDRYAYFNRRAELYGELSLLLDPTYDTSSPGFSLPRCYPAIRQQLAQIPRTYDSEGRLRLLPKNKKDKDSKEKTLTELIGHSPDEVDALTLAIHMMQGRSSAARAGVLT